MAVGWFEAGYFEADPRMNSGILVVAAQRELRRNLFDALDQAGYPQIHSARDVSHAAILLEGRPSLPPLQLMVVVLAGDGQQALTACEQLRRLPGGSDTPLIVVLADEATINPADLPAGITDWLSAAQISNELSRDGGARKPDCKLRARQLWRRSAALTRIIVTFSTKATANG
jgi:CheY-like chemotaxis protein